MPIDLTAPTGPTFQQLLLAGLVLVVVATVWAIFRARARWAGLPDDQQRHVKRLLGQREDQSPRRLLFDRSEVLEDPSSVRARVSEAIEADADSVVAQDRTTVRQAVAEVRRAWGDGVASLTDRVPALVLQAWSLAGITVLLGSIAVYSVQQWRETLHGSGGGWNLRALAVDLWIVTTDIAAGGWNAMLEAIGAVPYVETLSKLVFAYGVLGVRWLYSHPIHTAVGIFAVATVVAIVDRRLNASDVVDPAIFTSRATLTWPFLKFIGYVWILSVGLATPFRLAGAPSLGDIVGFAAGGLFMLGAIVLAVLRLVGQLRRRARVDWAADRAALVVPYLVLRKLVGGLIGVAIVLGVFYLVSILTAGTKVLELVDVVVTAPAHIQVVIGGLALAVIVLAVWAARDVWPDLKAAIADALSKRAIKAAIFGRGIPIAVVVTVYILATTFGLGIIAAAVAALVFGVVVRLAYRLLARARYRASMIDPKERLPQRVIVHAYTLKDADGTEHELISVNGVDVAHADHGELVDAAVTTATDLCEDGEAKPTVAQKHAADLLERGIVRVETDQEDVPATMKRLRAEIRRTVFGTLKNEGGAARREQLHEELEEYPEDVVSRLLSKWEIHGTHEGMIREQGNYYELRSRSGSPI